MTAIANRWNRTADRLPEPGVVVLAWTRHTGFRLTYRTHPDETGAWGWSGACGNFGKRVQPPYWMSLPPDPMQEETFAGIRAGEP